MELCFSLICLSDPRSENTRVVFHRPSEKKKKKLFFRYKVHGEPDLKRLKKNLFFFFCASGRGWTLAEICKKKKKAVLFRVKSMRKFCVFSNYDPFFCGVAPVCIGTSSFDAIDSQIVSILRVWSGTKRIPCRVWLLTRCQCARVGFVIIISDGLQSVFVLLGFVLTLFPWRVSSLLRVKEIKKMMACSLTFVVADWWCVGTDPGHNTGFQTILHTADLVGTRNRLHWEVANIVNPALPSFPLLLLASFLHPTKGNRFIFSMILERAAHAIWPGKKKHLLWFFPIFLIWTWQ